MNAFVRIVSVAIAVALTGNPAAAAWLTIRNDTKQELVIQNVVLVNGQPKPGRAVKLLPGESIRENQLSPGSRGIRVFNPANLVTPLLVGTLKWDREDVTISLTPDQKSVALAVVPPKKP